MTIRIKQEATKQENTNRDRIDDLEKASLINQITIIILKNNSKY